MKVFLCWSGTRSKGVANALYEWLPRVIQALDPWISVDIDKGARWSVEVQEHLDNSPVGIVCLTRENIASKWLHFEAGALARSLNKTPVCTLLLPGLQPGEVPSPLSLFQHTTTSKTDIQKLVLVLNSAVAKLKEKFLAARALDDAFERNWPDLEQKLRRLAAARSRPTVPVSGLGDLADEMSHQLSRAGVRFDAPTVASGASLSEAPLEVQLNVRRLLGELTGGFERLTRAQRALVYGGGRNALFEMARALMVEHRWVDAARYLDEYAEVNPRDWQVQKWRGIAHAMSHGGHAADAAALDAYKQAIASLAPGADRNTKALLFNYRAAMYKRLQRYAEAEEDLQKALRFATDELLKKDIHYNFACIFALTGRREPALAQVRYLKTADREKDLVRKHLNDYFRSLASDPKFLQLIGAQRVRKAAKERKGRGSNISGDG